MYLSLFVHVIPSTIFSHATNSPGSVLFPDEDGSSEDALLVLLPIIELSTRILLRKRYWNNKIQIISILTWVYLMSRNTFLGTIWLCKLKMSNPFQSLLRIISNGLGSSSRQIWLSRWRSLGIRLSVNFWHHIIGLDSRSNVVYILWYYEYMLINGIHFQYNFILFWNVVQSIFYRKPNSS